MYLALIYKVTFKNSPKEPIQSITFPKKEAADGFALAVENEGGIAIVTSSYEKTISMPTDFPSKRG